MNGTGNDKNKVEQSTLYLVATPIGNLSDISERGLKILSEVDFIAAEDTRVSAKLLSRYGIKSSVVSYHEHNRIESGKVIISRLVSGESCALITDAGTPAISDPGADLVKLCIDNGINVTSVPGACAAITALTLSGLDTAEFLFVGFLTGSEKEIIEKLEETIAAYRVTLIFYEAPHKLKNTLRLMLETLGDRQAALCRELTKLNEETLRCSLSEAVKYYEINEPKGEYVIIVEGNKNIETPFWNEMTVKEHFMYYVDNIGIEKISAIKKVARDRNVSKNTIYQELI
jgi:16S rRNA (cytidine1402-2'-O)-methyltransferase